MSLRVVTLTGADDSIDPKELIEVSEKYPFVEWGILITGPREVWTSRFPSFKWIEKLLSLATPNVRLVAHLCGGPVYEALIYNGFFWAEEHGLSTIEPFQRVQLNTHGARLQGLAETPTWTKNFKKEFIFQCDGVNDNLVKEWVGQGLGVPLFDTSSGAGVLPEGWPKIWETYCGYAGGLGPSNVVEELKKIERVADDKPFWIDMETRVRSNRDQLFDMGKVKFVLEAAKPFVEGQ